MGDLLRKGFLLGLGAAVSGKEKLEQKLKELVDKNELTQEQARTVLNNFMEKGETKKNEWSAKQYEQTQQMIKDLGIATKDDIDALRSRIKELEEKVNK
ncbi:hypothetical protein F3157_10590 [Virgibacillus dakarensis]|uniref:Polyhydroxyalkanoate synthesis regulator n=1 Tax=Lentibacillus populi TaxID=1827502 RepID=A0A9W5TVE3_9BACI|nr:MULTISPECIES: hypothetical protein [Bacillaceae]MBT2215258.1 hypothetical protein [Virgibacillus dakarensis]MTW86103.1 hypothetical protein [Virgibacillus dakarensis]GGB35050.1 hypothetical protein GCM10011409_10660 [Lentibacillus populi]